MIPTTSRNNFRSTALDVPSSSLWIFQYFTDNNMNFNEILNVNMLKMNTCNKPEKNKHFMSLQTDFNVIINLISAGCATVAWSKCCQGFN